MTHFFAKLDVDTKQQKPGMLFLVLLFFASIFCANSQNATAQILAGSPHRNEAKVLERPASYSANKERALIREILDPELILRLEPGQSKIIRTNYPVVRSAISHPGVVDLQPFDFEEIEVIAKAPGQTSLTLWFEVPNGKVHVLRYHVSVDNEKEKERKREARYQQLQSRINELFPNSQVFLIPIEDKVIVKGQARDAKEASDILQVLGQAGNRGNQNGFGGQRSGNNGRGGFAAGGGRSGGFGGAGGGNLSFLDAGGGGQNQGGPQNGFGDEDLGIPNFINMLHVPGEQQVMLKVRIAELVRSSNRTMGVDLSTVFGSVELSHLISGGGNLTAILNDGDVRFLLQAIASHGYGKILAEPTLVTISGKAARFQAGGEFAVPTSVGVGGIGAVSTTFHGFGTELSFTPTVTDKDKVRLEVAPSFSTINPDATVGGIPGLSRRSVETTVDLREGQWLAIAGLIQDEQGGQRTRLPFAGDMPILGNLFGNHDTSRRETELIVLVSPELVHPMEADQVPLLLPGMEITDPTNDDFFFRHQTEGYQGFHHRSTVWPEVQTQYDGLKREAFVDGMPLGIGRRLRSQKAYICGPSGFSE